jgi:hypothetical protein
MQSIVFILDLNFGDQRFQLFQHFDGKTALRYGAVLVLRDDLRLNRNPRCHLIDLALNNAQLVFDFVTS